ncbi:hypothetical protein QUF80_17850 [Desulfococcaceae bacterium HSG8]|nr:hypothetical protein [Desulfococcaceae bacterium HSG8]
MIYRLCLITDKMLPLGRAEINTGIPGTLTGIRKDSAARICQIRATWSKRRSRHVDVEHNL